MAANDLKVETQLQINKPNADVFEAIVNPEKMACYFITSGSGRLDAGQQVTWSWADHDDARLTITPLDIEKDRKVVFSWAATGTDTRVAIDLESGESGTTTVKVCETGWPLDKDGAANSLMQMQGWMHMLCCLKAYLEYQINLRTGSEI